jgi:hypothetical protein
VWSGAGHMVADPTEARLQNVSKVSLGEDAIVDDLDGARLHFPNI